MSWRLIEGDAELAEALAAHASATAVAVDTEFMRRNTYFPKVALVQLCFESEALLIDPLTLGSTQPLKDLLTDDRTVKVLHSASEDLEVFDHWLGVLPQPLFDTQRGAALLNRGFGLGYRALVLEHCDVDLPKGETRSDWLQRPLTQSQCEYAAQDVTYLQTVYRDLLAAAEQVGRVDWVLAEGADAVAAFGQSRSNYYRKIKSAWHLRPQQLAALESICQWREATAIKRDKPRGWIIDDKACLAIAKAMPASVGQLARATELPQGAVRRFGDALLGCVAECAERPDAECPAPLPEPLNSGQRNKLKALKARARAVAEGLDMAPEALLQAKDYELLLRESEGVAIHEPAHWWGWRETAAIQPLRQYLTGEGAA